MIHLIKTPKRAEEVPTIYNLTSSLAKIGGFGKSKAEETVLPIDN